MHRHDHKYVIYFTSPWPMSNDLRPVYFLLGHISKQYIQPQSLQQFFQGCHNKKPKAEKLKQNLFSNNAGGYKYKSKSLAVLISSEAFLLVLQMVTLLLCPHMVAPGTLQALAGCLCPNCLFHSQIGLVPSLPPTALF